MSKVQRGEIERSPTAAPAQGRGDAGGARSVLVSSLALLGAWTTLDLCFNVRYPGPEPPGWYLLPSLDATVLVGVTAFYARRGRPVPRAIVVAAAALLVVVRLLRIGDGVTRRYFNRPLNLALDLPLTSEMVRLLGATVSPAALVLGIALALGVLVGVGLVAARVVRVAERALASSRMRTLFVCASALAALASPLMPAAETDAKSDRRLGAFGASVIPRLARETAFLFNLGGIRAADAARIAATDAQLRARPHGLDKLHGAHVLLFFIESYGATVIAQPEYAREMEPVYRDVAATLAQGGFFVASSLLDSPTYAGRSWLAHETLATGGRVADRIADELVQRARPVTIARFFRDVGYRTVFAQPANRYRSLSRWLYDFDALYSGWDFDYRGPGFRWANMPDQYVIDFIHRHEIVPARKPLLVAYALVSSHAPWSEQPRMIDDWSRIGNGAVYGEVPIDRFPITWTNLAQGGKAYVQSVSYDLRVLADYVTRFVPGDTLVIFLGDHQPVAEVTRFDVSHAVPIHVISRERSFIERFEARRYVPGMHAATVDSPRGMETFLPDLLADFSTAPTLPSGAPALPSP